MFDITMVINNMKRTFSVAQDYSLAWAIYQNDASVLQIPAHTNVATPLWVLINETYLVNADKVTIFAMQESRVITINYALEITYFQQLFHYLSKTRVNLCMENIALLIFSLHTWIQHPHNNVKQEIIHLMDHFPQYTTQPESIYQAFLHSYKNIESLRTLFTSFIQHHTRNAAT